MVEMSKVHTANATLIYQDLLAALLSKIQNDARKRAMSLYHAFNLLSSHPTHTGLWGSASLVKNLPSSKGPLHSYIMVSIHNHIRETASRSVLTEQTKQSPCQSASNALMPSVTTGLLQPLHFPLNFPAWQLTHHAYPFFSTNGV